MSKAGYGVTTEGAVALSAATAASIIGVKSTSDFGLDLKKYRIGFDGVTASAVPVLVEVCYCTFGASSPGTNSTSTTPRQQYGRVIAAGFTSGKTWTTEPTTITVIESNLLTPNGGALWYDWPLGDTPDSAVSEGFVLRCTAPAAVNVRASLVVERC